MSHFVAFPFAFEVVAFFGATVFADAGADAPLASVPAAALAELRVERVAGPSVATAAEVAAVSVRLRCIGEVGTCAYHFFTKHEPWEACLNRCGPSKSQGGGQRQRRDL